MPQARKAAFGPAPKSVVSHGRFATGRFGTLFRDTGMLGVDKPYLYPIPKFLKNLRLKEWQAYQFGDSRWFFFCSIYNAKLITFIEFQAYDRSTKKRFTARRIFPGSKMRVPSTLFGSFLRYSSGHLHLAFSADLKTASGGRQCGNIGIEVSKSDRRGIPEFEGKFTLAFDSALQTPNVVCLPFGLNRSMYSAKMLLPMEGWFREAGSRTVFSGPGSLGIMDDHKGYYPWRLRYDWVTGFGVDKLGRAVGFNLTDNQVRDQAKYNENCVWIDGELWPLPPVKVTRPNGAAGEWIIQDTEGLVDLVFVPEAPNDIRIRAIVIESEYHGPFGSFRGRIGGSAGNLVDASIFYGMGEQQYLRI